MESQTMSRNKEQVYETTVPNTLASTQAPLGINKQGHPDPEQRRQDRKIGSPGLITIIIIIIIKAIQIQSYGIKIAR